MQTLHNPVDALVVEGRDACGGREQPAYRLRRILVEHRRYKLHTLEALRLAIQCSLGAVDAEHEDELVGSVQVVFE